MALAMLVVLLTNTVSGQDRPAQNPLAELESRLKREATVDEINGIRSRLGSGVQSSLSELVDPKELNQEFGKALKELAKQEQQKSKQRADEKPQRLFTGQGRLLNIPPGKVVAIVRIGSNDEVPNLLAVGSRVDVISRIRSVIENGTVEGVRTICKSAVVANISAKGDKKTIGLIVSKEQAKEIDKARKSGEVKLVLINQPSSKRPNERIRDLPLRAASQERPQGRFPQPVDQNVRSRDLRNPNLREEESLRDHLQNQRRNVNAPRRTLQGDRIQSRVHPQPRRDAQALVLREVARRLEELAAELEEAGLHGEADGLRDQARDFWHRSR